jgi:3-hydroxyisobutyrate dehydrogenase-like beta-hydroxyacid dehydrogenase
MAIAGVIGLGAMGGPIAGHMMRAGLRVCCFDLDAEVTARYGAAGAQAASTAGEVAASSSVVFVFVPADDDVMGVCTAELFPAALPDTVVVICSSVRPDTCAAVAAAAPAGVTVLDAALTGGVRGAEQGRINLLAGGDEAALDRIRPLLDPWTAGVHHLGPLGSGQVAKTVNNLIHWGQISAITEALRLGEAYGLDVPSVRRALMDGPTDSRTLRELEQMRFTWWAKDIDNAHRMAEQVGVRLRVAPVSRAVMAVTPIADVLRLLNAGPPVSGGSGDGDRRGGGGERAVDDG